jgi:predicted dehydrogenase
VPEPIGFGLIGGGLMGREFASAVSRWLHLLDHPALPRIVAVCDTDPAVLDWYRTQLPGPLQTTTDHRELLANGDVDAVYCAVPHHLHQRVFTDVIAAGKHLLGEKPFGIDLAANRAILETIAAHPNLLVRCSSEIPYFPGAYQIGRWCEEGRFGRIIEVEAGMWHSSDLDPGKQINWKRRAATNGVYGCMGDLGMHVVHLPFRFGWVPKTVRALLSDIVTERPDAEGRMIPCDTWDNAILACEVVTEQQRFPMLLSTKRIAPGHGNTWFVRVMGSRFSAQFSTRNPKRLLTLDYTPGGEQAWAAVDAPYRSAYPTVSGAIFEFGFSDAILQMIAAFCDEVVNRERMRQPFHCATPEEAGQSHLLFTAALRSQAGSEVVQVEPVSATPATAR